MANSTQQFALNVTSVATTITAAGLNGGADPDRRYIMIRNYSDSVQIIWVAFGNVATCGTAGEVEVLPGYTYEFGTTRLVAPNGLVANNETRRQPNCPVEYISVICGARNNPTGTAVGALMVISP
jgi:hypothetical protein